MTSGMTKGREPGRFRVPDRAAPGVTAVGRRRSMAVRHHAVIGTPVADGRDQQRQQCPDLARTLAAFRELLDGGFARPPSWTPAPAARCVRSPYRSASARRIPSAPPVSRNGCPSRLVRRRVNGSRQASCSTTTAACRPMKYPGPKRARFVGMHVVDLKSGHVLSALLGSANGRRPPLVPRTDASLRWARPTPQAAGSIASHSGTSRRAAHPRSSTHRRCPEQRDRRWPFRGAVRRCGHSARAN